MVQLYRQQKGVSIYDDGAGGTFRSLSLELGVWILELPKKLYSKSVLSLVLNVRKRSFKTGFVNCQLATMARLQVWTKLEASTPLKLHLTSLNPSP